MSRFLAIATALHLRYHDSMVLRYWYPPCRSIALEPIGFGVYETFFPKDNRLFDGFDLLREYFTFPRKFLGFRLKRLNRVLAGGARPECRPLSSASTKRTSVWAPPSARTPSPYTQYRRTTFRDEPRSCSCTDQSARVHVVGGP